MASGTQADIRVGEMMGEMYDRAQQPSNMPGQRRQTIAERLGKYLRGAFSSAGTWLFATAIASSLIYGWYISPEQYLSAEEGPGYYLGIVGASMMLALLLYPLRKRARLLRGLGSVAFWFRSHMMLGIIGPTLILFHANFKLGSLNSSVALISMLVVAASGIVGRYFYSRIYMGLHGHKASARELAEDAGAFKHAMGAELVDATFLARELSQYERDVLSTDLSFWGSLALSVSLGRRTRKSQAKLLVGVRRMIKQQAPLYGWSRRQRNARFKASKRLLSAYFSAVRKSAQLALFERLFAAWHVLHLPLFFVLVAAALIHIAAVHLY